MQAAHLDDGEELSLQPFSDCSSPMSIVDPGKGLDIPRVALDANIYSEAVLVLLPGRTL